MNTCTPSDFLKRWPKSLIPIVLPDPPPVLPDDCSALLTKFGLPNEVLIHCYNDISMKFSGKATPLDRIWNEDVKRGYALGEMPGEWASFWHLGNQEYLQGGGWICVEECTGRLVIIDLDCSEPIYVINANLHHFYTTLAYFLDWTERVTSSISAIRNLRDALLQQDCVTVEELEPFWLNFIDATIDSNLEELAVSLKA